MSDETGWFADVDDPEDEGRIAGWPWVVVLQTEGCCFTLESVRFKTKDECEAFINSAVIGKGMLP